MTLSLKGRCSTPELAAHLAFAREEYAGKPYYMRSKAEAAISLT